MNLSKIERLANATHREHWGSNAHFREFAKQLLENSYEVLEDNDAQHLIEKLRQYWSYV